MKMKKRALLKLIFVGFVCFSIAACGDENMLEDMADKDSDEAKLEDARIAIDEGEWQVAIDGLESEWESSGDPEIGADLAAAYMGLAGFDALSLLENAETAADNPSANDEFTLISQVLPDQSPENLASMDEAVNILLSINNRTEEADLQLAMASVSLAILNIGVDWGVDFDADGNPIDVNGDPVAYVSGDVGDTAVVMTNISTAVGAATDAGLTGTDGTDIGSELTDLLEEINLAGGLDSYLLSIF